ncbi:putative siroheme synthase [Sphingomonas changbaiensis NBRC 104936]|uniref:precorrin-2 dehydrogenase n=1 Tax=Sphingomonas changbaiensis NBRC 104936 TaxID=1219043 RepID=A0A0E9MSL3_9SPHN|nr:bifunctional precorrin-2 dehydrogenase/sirohydrochlorin ferrochelatase [Sphingomonas changbaiensis]GAO40559.1 putative siroheme synthase [Sphingomonas changbaiensis NBRC 104936]
MHSLPVFLRLTGRPVILLGNGEAAEAKRRLLERAGATIVGEDSEARLAIVALDGLEPVVARLKARGILVNAVDRPDLCDFTLPAIVDRNPVLVAIGTGGSSAGLAAALRQRMEVLLSPKLGELAMLLHDAREKIRQAFPDSAERRLAIARALMPGGVLDLDDPFEEDPFWIDDLQQGADWGLAIIRLCSPDPDELTLKQARLLGQADRIFHRADVPAAILDRARADAVRIACDAPPDAPGPGLSLDISMGNE